MGLELAMFYVLATIAVVTSALVIGQRSPVYSVMLLIASFGALAGLYVTLDAPFVARLPDGLDQEVVPLLPGQAPHRLSLIHI